MKRILFREGNCGLIMRSITRLLLPLSCLMAPVLFGQKKDLQFGFEKVQPCLFLIPPSVSAVKDDATDPAATCGIAVSVMQDGRKLAADDYTILAVSSNGVVLRDSGIHIRKEEGVAVARLLPSGVGFADVTFTLSAKKSTASLLLHYAASDAPADALQTVWHTGGSDASAAVPVGRYMMVADDELDNLFLYDRSRSGLPVASFYYGDKLDLTDGSAPFFKEVDVEAGVASPDIPNRTYWTGSMSNSANFNLKPNRNRLFAVDVKDTGSRTKCAMAGYYDDLREQLIRWGNDNGYKFGKSAASGQNPKEDNGFNVEAMAFAPDHTTLYIGFRAPLVPVPERKKAVIAPVKNFEEWFRNGKPKAEPAIGNPIELSLDGRGLRDIVRLSNGVYIILAGSPGDVRNGAVYLWSGKAEDDAVLIPRFDISKLNAEGVLEMDDEKGKLMPDRLQFVSDNGTTVYYGDERPAKELRQTAFRKFRSDVFISPEPVLNVP